VSKAINSVLIVFLEPILYYNSIIVFNLKLIDKYIEFTYLENIKFNLIYFLYYHHNFHFIPSNVFKKIGRISYF